MEIFAVGRPAPLDLRMAFATEGGATGGLVDLPNQRFFFRLADYRPADAEVFSGPAAMRVSRLRNSLLMSPVFGALNFDVIWSPVIGRAANEPAMAQPGPEEHLVFHFILLDGDMIVRSIRMASVSPAVSQAIWRAREELLRTSATAASVIDEVNALFHRYPRSVPDGHFHEICALGD